MAVNKFDNSMFDAGTIGTTANKLLQMDGSAKIPAVDGSLLTGIPSPFTTSASDPRGFASGDAGKGALVDGSGVNQQSVSANMLFHAVTFITPGVDGLTIKGGVRVEWLNSFTYFDGPFFIWMNSVFLI